MKTLEQQMAVYAAYHRNRWNRLTHFFGVPAIIFAILVPMAWLRLPLGEAGLTGAALFSAVSLLYYLYLDLPFGMGVAAVALPLLYAAEFTAQQPRETAWAICGIAFAGGWIVQLVGHAFEGRRPALADNVLQVFVAPLFLAAETAFMLGLRKDTQREVESLSHRHDA